MRWFTFLLAWFLVLCLGVYGSCQPRRGFIRGPVYGQCSGGNCVVFPHDPGLAWTPKTVIQPAPITAPPIQPAATPLPTGVIHEQSWHRDSVKVGGIEVTGSSGPTASLPLPEDGKKPFVVVVGDANFQAEAKSALSKIPTASQWHVGYWSENDWQVKDCGPYPPGVTLTGPREPSGTAKGLSYQKDLADLEKAMEAATGGLRKPDPSWKPELVPDLRRRIFPELDWLRAGQVGKVVGLATLVGLAISLAFVSRRGA